MKKNLKIALVTDWLTQLGGAEKVVALIAELYPDAPIYTSFYLPKNTKSEFPDSKRIRPSFFNKIPGIANRQITLAPFAKSAISSLNLKEFDIIISFSSAIAKNVKILPHQKHICYIHTPIRYAWQPKEDKRFDIFPKIMQPMISKYLERLRNWDFENSKNVDLFIANSSETANRVKKYYNRESDILFPPVAFHEFKPCLSAAKKKYFFAFGRFVKYKKFDLLVDTFLENPDLTLYLGGSGSEKKILEEKVKKSGVKNIKFLGRLKFKDLKKYLSEAQALILPQKEDAGIVQLEAFASGTPVVAYKSGGVLDVLQEGINGEFFTPQNKKSLSEALKKFKSEKFDSLTIRKTAEKYSSENFQKNFKKLVDDFLGE